MMNLKYTIRFFLLMLLLEVAIIGIALLAFAAADARAHTPAPSACMNIWKAAPTGSKHSAKQRCLAAQRRHTCLTHPRTIPGYVRVKGQLLQRGHGRRYSPHWRNQRKVLGWIVNEGIRRDLPYTIVLSSIVGTTQESSARELNYGHGSSLGPWQLISSHGSAAQRTSVEFSGNWFYNGAVRKYRRGMGAAELAQAVERSGHPYAYRVWVPEARRTLNAALGAGCELRR